MTTAAEHRQSIERLLYVYAQRIDRGDLEGVAALFCHGRIVAPSNDEPVVGEEAVLAMYRQSTRIYPETGTPCTQHCMSNPIITLDNDGHAALGHTRFTVFQGLADFPIQPIIAGHYNDRFAIIDGQWWFTEREIVSELFGDLSRHLLFDPFK